MITTDPVAVAYVGKSFIPAKFLLVPCVGVKVNTPLKFFFTFLTQSYQTKALLKQLGQDDF